MLDLAYLNIGTLKQLYMQYIKKNENKYYLIDFFSNYDIQIDPNDWNRIQYVSKDFNGNIIAYFEARINRGFNIINDLEILKFIEYPNIIWIHDFIRFLKVLLLEKNFRKVVFYAIIDNPSFTKCELYLLKYKLVKEVGVMKNHCILNDGKIYDMKIFEIERDNLGKW